MEERKYQRYTYTHPYGDAYEIVDKKIDTAMKPEDVTKLLNKQTKRIKELEEENGYIIFADGYDENGNEVHKQEFVKYKDKFRELLEENKKLKQSQKELAIREFEKLRAELVNNVSPAQLSYTDYVQQIYMRIDNQIKELRGEE